VSVETRARNFDHVPDTACRLRDSAQGFVDGAISELPAGGSLEVAKIWHIVLLSNYSPAQSIPAQWQRLLSTSAECGARGKFVGDEHARIAAHAGLPI